jgi:hypothetical protein
LVTDVLHCTEEETVKILLRRAKLSRTTKVQEALMQLDDGLDVIDKGESEAMKKEKQKMKSKLPEDTEFRAKVASKAREVRTKAAGPASKKRKTEKGKKAEQVAVVRQRVPEGDISQIEAKLMLPADCSIWRDRMNGGWCCHLSGHSRISARWNRDGGERGSLLMLLRKVWEEHLAENGLDQSECPIEGLFSSSSSGSA